MISRRNMLRIGSSVASWGLTSRFSLMNAMAESTSDYRALVCVFLFGGNDGNNTVVPVKTAQQSYTDYASVRDTLAIPLASLVGISAGSGDAYGLHPSLKNLAALYTKKQVGVIANVGMLFNPLSRSDYQNHTMPVPTNLFSHSDQQSQWQSDPNQNPASGTTGWAGRVADHISVMNAPSTFPTIVSVGGGSLFSVGQQERPTVVVPGQKLGLAGYDTPTAASTERELAVQQLLQFDNGLQLVQAANSITGNGIRDAKFLNAALTGAPALQTVFPANNSLASQLQQVARIMQVRTGLGMKRQIFFCSLGNFDTHADQLTTQANLLSMLDGALGAFYQATVELGIQKSVVTFTESDFGRTFQPNGTQGTDHAWGNNHFVMGGDVNGGDFYGRYATLALNGPQDTDNRGRFIPTLSVDQYGATLASWFGVQLVDLPVIFPNLPNFLQKNLGFLA